MSLLQRALDRAENPETELSPEPEVLKVPDSKNSVREKRETLDHSKVKVSPAASIPAMIPVIKQTETSTHPQHEAPRLNAIRFYETQNQTVEEAIQEVKKVSEKNLASTSQEETKDSKINFLGLIFLLLIVSLGAIRFVLPPSKGKVQEAVVGTPALSEVPQTVIVKAHKPLIAKPVSQVRFLLTGITASGDTDLAVINNQVVGTGDKLREGATVKSINGNRVVLDLDGKQITLTF